MKPEFKSALKSYAVEAVIYSALVAGYYFLVLHFLGNWLYRMFVTDRRDYAALALGLIIGQGFLLEILTRFLLNWFKPTKEP